MPGVIGLRNNGNEGVLHTLSVPKPAQSDEVGTVEYTDCMSAEE